METISIVVVAAFIAVMALMMVTMGRRKPTAGISSEELDRRLKTLDDKYKAEMDALCETIKNLTSQVSTKDLIGENTTTLKSASASCGEEITSGDATSVNVVAVKLKIDDNLDEGRLADVKGMTVAPGRSPHTFTVYGAGAPHEVVLNYKQGECSCDCSDFNYRHLACRHIIAARWFCKDAYVIGRLGPMSADAVSHAPVYHVVDSGSCVKVVFQNEVTDERHWFCPLAKVMAAYVCSLAEGTGEEAAVIKDMIDHGRISVQYLNSRFEENGFAIAFDEAMPGSTDTEKEDRIRRAVIEKVFDYAVSQLKGGVFAERLSVYRTFSRRDLGEREDVVWSNNRKHKWTVNKKVVGIEFAVGRRYQVRLSD